LHPVLGGASICAHGIAHSVRLAFQAGLDGVGQAVGGLESGAGGQNVELDSAAVAVHRPAERAPFFHGAGHISRMAASPAPGEVMSTAAPSSSNVIQLQHSRSTSMSLAQGV